MGIRKGAIPGVLINQDGDDEEEEHEEHGGMLEIVEVGGVDGAVHCELEMGGIEKLDAHVGERPDEEDVELQVARLAAEAASGVPHARPERLGIHHVVGDRVQQVPQSHQQEHGPRQHMALERPHRPCSPLLP
jgi:hypothetical protein